MNSLPGVKRAEPRVYARRPKSNKDRVLAQWRRVDLRPDEVAFRSTERHAGEVMVNVLSALKLEQRRAETEVMKVWNHLIDARITAHAQPAGIVKGTLFVVIDSSVWLDEIVRYRRKDILTRLQTAFGREVIKKISFRVG
jgi:predicted nucleic acid-binding Zn ribbon protein